MKILYVTTISNTLNAFLIPHIKMLVDMGHQVDIACKTESKLEEELLKLVDKCHEISFNRTPLNKQNFIAYKQMQRIIVREDYDIVHTHTPVASLITRLVCKSKKSSKVFYTAHGFHFFKGAPYKNWAMYYPIEKFLSRYTDALITINEEDYQFAYSKKWASGSVHKINGVGIDLEKIIPQNAENKKETREKLDYSLSDFILFYAAELNFNKHQDLLIKTVKELKKSIPNIKLLLAGTGTHEVQYKQLVNDLGLKENIHFLGYTNQVAEYVRIADLVVASSRREGLPVNIIEAMATGVPIIATDVRGHRDLIKNNVNGYLVAEEETEFVQAILKLYLDKELMNKMSQENLELAQKYSTNVVVQQMMDIYEL